MIKRLQEELIKLKDQIWEHEEIVRMRNRFQELDPKTQQTILAAGSGIALSIFVGILITLLYSSFSLKSELHSINGQIEYIQDANQKMDIYRRRLREQGPGSIANDVDKNAPLPAYAASAAQKSSIPKESIELIDKAGSVEMKLNKISLRQLLRVLFVIENIRNGTNITKVETDSKNDPEGYLWATVHLQRAASINTSNSPPQEKKSLFTR